MIAREFDVVVIGTGSAGKSVAFACARGGKRVAIVDKRPFGGTCALRGCDPKKVLVGAEDVVVRRNALADSETLNGALSIDWPKLIRFKRTFTEPVPAQREASFDEAGIVSFHGAARFADPSTIALEDTLLRTQHIVIAAGARPVALGIPGEAYVTTSDRFLELNALPKRIAFIGGGYVSFEFAHVAARCGATTTILHRGTRPLERFDGDLVSRLVEASQEAGIAIDVDTEVHSVERGSDGLIVHTSRKSYPVDMVVHGAGREPEIDELDLERGQVKRSKNGVTVNAFLQSETNPNVYAAGDAVDSGGPPLTPVAALTGEIVAENILRGNQREAHLDAVPSLVFSNPMLGAVGAGEGSIKESNVDVKTGDMAEWYAYKRIGERYAAYKIVIDKAEDRVLGAHILGPGAEELINVFTLAIHHRIPASRLRDALFGYPTYSSDISEML